MTSSTPQIGDRVRVVSTVVADLRGRTGTVERLMSRRVTSYDAQVRFRDILCPFRAEELEVIEPSA